MKLTDTLFHWLQIRLVADSRPEDIAAARTVAFFEELLAADHQVEEISIVETDATMVHVRYQQNGHAKRQLYHREAAGQLLSALEADTRYGA
ncbi:hypothetical protein [Gorillibacterium timonense]|uniref:hypothetical protein n=1 Tax=Gorillibacterium timonense TaxID=1689269 RepID=UPI00071E0E5B|nr:hypothetical protein [Gorillibacterium timonense]